jgi:hypothetical protein
MPRFTRTAGPLGRLFGFTVDIGRFFASFNSGWYFASIGHPAIGCVYLGKWDIWVYSTRFGIDWAKGVA